MHKSKQEPQHTLYTALVMGIDFSFRTIATFFPPAALHIHASVAAASRELLEQPGLDLEYKAFEDARRRSGRRGSL